MSQSYNRDAEKGKIPQKSKAKIKENTQRSPNFTCKQKSQR